MARKKQMMRHTTVAVALSLNVQVYKNGQSQLLTLPLLSLTRVMMWWWQTSTTVQGWVNSVKIQTERAVQTITAIATAGCKALLFNIELSYAPG